jgi:acyl-CoA dehydrogenase
MPAVDELLIETIESLLSDHCEPEQVGAAEGGLDAKLWGALTESGLATVGVAESAGGSGGTLHDAAAIAKAAGRFAAPVPLTETSLIGGWVCEQAGLQLPDGPMAVVIASGAGSGAGPDGTFTARRVPWAAVAASLLIVTDGGVAVVDPTTLTLQPGTNYAGEPYADVAGPQPGAGTLVPGPSPAAVRARGALARSLLMAGALQQAVDLSVQYANERVQFGRPIGKFQVIQNYLAEIAGEAATAEAAADNAVDVVAAGAGPEDTARIVGAAKAVTGRAAGIVNRIAHQVHGAIGYTDEHRLQYTTRRLWSWRDEYGTDAEWAAVLGASLCRVGGAALWPLLTSWPPAEAG